jgi:hypothetical protein
MISSLEISFWRHVSADLGIDIVSPFDLVFPDRTQLEVSALVKNFGTKHGMLIAASYDSLKPHVQKITQLGYGYSSNIGGSLAEYDRSTIVDVLKDWGWSETENEKPNWL